MQQGDTDEDKWKVLSLTHVEYQEGDSLGKLFAIYSLLPLAIVIVFLTAFFFRRDLHTLTFGVGVIVNYAANTVLKKYIAEPRPKQRYVFNSDTKFSQTWNSCFRSVQFEEFGMPSSHSQFMWFCSAYLVLFTLFRLTHTVTWKTLSVALYLGASSLMSYSRVYLQYHTPSQVVWGGVVGGLGALLWFLATQLLFTPLYPTVERWALSEYFMIR